MTGWAVVIFSLAVGLPDLLLENEIITRELAATLGKYLSYVGTVLGVLGIRRRLPGRGVAVATAKVADIRNGEAGHGVRGPE
jgi:hypothetical protein